MARLEHIGIAVDDVDAAVNCFRDLLGEEPYKQETVAEQQVRTHVLDVDTAKLELWEALVDRLAVFQTNVDWTRPQAERMWQRLDLDALKDNAPKQAEHLQARHDPPHLLKQLREFVETLPDASEELAQGLSELSTPTLVGAVDRDPLFGPEAPEALYQMLPDARLAILPGEHHNLAKAPLFLLSSLLQQHFSAQ